MSRTLHILTSGGLTLLATLQVAARLHQLAIPLLLISIAVFWTARLIGAIVDRIFLPSALLVFHEDLARDLLLYALLAGVTTAAIMINQWLTETIVSPVGPAIAVHMCSLLFRRRET